MEYDLHPQLAFQTGQVQPKKQYDVHPALQVEIMPEMPEDIPVMDTVLPEQPEAMEAIAETPEIEQAVVPQPEPQEDTKQRDWRLVRQKADEAKHLAREKEALERERDFYRQQALNQQTRQPEPEEEYQTETEKRLARKMQMLEEQAARQEKELANATNQSRVANAKARLAQDYPDYNRVLTDENINRLQYEHPALYNAAISSNDPYAVGAAAYEFVVAKGIYQQPKNTLAQMTQGNSAARNAAKPRNAATLSPQSGENPIRSATNFMNGSISSEEERKNLYKEMLIATGRSI